MFGVLVCDFDAVGSRVDKNAVLRACGKRHIVFFMETKPKLDQSTYMDVVRWRSYWDAYVAQQFVRLPPEAVADIHAALQVLNQPAVNWWCSGCITDALRVVFEAVDEYEKTQSVIATK